MDEQVTVFDAQGRVVGEAPRSQVYAEGLWHGSAGVLVRSADGRRLYVHRRTTTKAVFAGMHDCLAGGVIDAGETPLQTATRELREELGITGHRRHRWRRLPGMANGRAGRCGVTSSRSASA